MLDCLGNCDPTDSECGFACGLGTEAGQNPNFISLMQCLVEHECMDKYDELGACLATDDQAMDITDYDMVRKCYWLSEKKHKSSANLSRNRRSRCTGKYRLS